MEVNAIEKKRKKSKWIRFFASFIILFCWLYYSYFYAPSNGIFYAIKTDFVSGDTIRLFST